MIPKFRAWDKTTNQMRGCYGFNEMELEVYVCSVADDEFNGRLKTVHALKRSFDEVVIMQSTGLKDKNGVDIFEGDICNVGVNKWGTIITRTGEVIFDEYDIQFQIMIEDFLTITGKSGFETGEVIGNIWENPELMEVAE